MFEVLADRRQRDVDHRRVEEDDADPRIVEMIVKRRRRRSSDKAHRVYGGKRARQRGALARRRTKRETARRSMRGRATFIALACAALVAAPAPARWPAGVPARADAPPISPLFRLDAPTAARPSPPTGRGAASGSRSASTTARATTRRSPARPAAHSTSHATFFEIGQETPGRAVDDEEDPAPRATRSATTRSITRPIPHPARCTRPTA